jgi:membrane-associated phospholipid phosphatase
MRYLLRFALLSSIILCRTDLAPAQSPYKLSWEKDGYILGVGGACLVSGYFFYHSASSPTVGEINQLHRGSVNGLDRSATYRFSERADITSDILIGITTAAPLFLLTDKNIQNDECAILLMYAEVWSFIGGTSMLSKGSIKRYRPYVYNPDVPLEKKLVPDARMSFFSNHAAAAFASAVFISKVFGDYNPHSNLRPYIWAGSLLAASAVGYFRYEAGMHFPTDIIAGAAIGSFIGYIIPWMHHIRDSEITVAPHSPGAQYGFSVQINF